MKVIRTCFLSTVLLLLFIAPPALAGGPITVDGQNDQLVDRQAIQDAIDQADDGDTVRLRGTFQLDGTGIVVRKELRLRGETVDDDSDGLTNEDWADGIDNDGDGALDEDDWDTALRGLVDGDGLPLGPLPDGTRFNRAIVIEGLLGEVEDIEIRDLAFFGFDRALSVLPDLRDDGGRFACADLVATGGSLEDLRVRRNRFDHNARAVQIFGSAEDTAFEDNVVRGGGSVQVLAVGERVFCGGGPPLAIGRPTETEFERNRVEALVNGAIITQGTVDTLVRGNTLVAPIIGYSADSDTRPEVKNNDIENARFAIFLAEIDGAARVSGNRVSGHNFGIGLVDVRGYRVTGNAFGTPGNVADVFLDDATRDNRVIVPDGTIVLDFGTDNIVIFE